MFSSTRWKLLVRTGNLSTRHSGTISLWLLGESHNQCKAILSLPQKVLFWLASPSPVRCPTALAVSKKVQWAGPCCHWPVRRLHWAWALIQASVVQRCRRMALSIPAPRQYIHAHAHTNTKTYRHTHHTHMHTHTSDTRLKSMHRHTYTHSI